MITTRTESTVITLFLFLVCPLSCLIFAWWTPASLSLFGVIPMSENVIISCALTGLALGIVVVVATRRQLVSIFYDLNRWIAAVLYLFWSAIALALFMGLPICNLVLGGCAGIYVGRKAYHHHISASTFKRVSRHVSLFTAIVVGIISIAMGILAVHDQTTMQTILGLIGLEWLASTTARKIVLVIIAVPVMTVAQYSMTHKMAVWVYSSKSSTAIA